jgi:hypothetical protein
MCLQVSYLLHAQSRPALLYHSPHNLTHRNKLPPASTHVTGIVTVTWSIVGRTSSSRSTEVCGWSIDQAQAILTEIFAFCYVLRGNFLPHTNLPIYLLFIDIGLDGVFF